MPHQHHLHPQLLAAQLARDPRIAEAKELLHTAVDAYRAQITGIRPPLAALKQSYQETIDAFSSNRSAKLWYPYLGSGIGNGALVELADGSVKYDLICGIGTHYCGHSSPLLFDAAIDAALSNTVMQGNLQQNIDSAALTSLLIKTSGLDHCFLSSSGAMANENALKIAFQKNSPANRILAFDRGFAGRSLALSQITDKATFREGLPSTVFVDYIPFFDERDPENSTKRTVNTLKQLLVRYPNQYAIMFLELIQGEGGFYCGSKEFFRALVPLLKENHIAVLADEVQTFARTPRPFAFQYFELNDLIDIVSIGKVSQVCATLFTDEYKPRPGLLSQTFTSSTSAIKVSYAMLSHLLQGNYFGPQGKINKLHAHFVSHLSALEKKAPHLLQGPFGMGTLIAFTPYEGDALKVTHFVHRLFDAGIISFIAGGGSIDRPTRVRFALPAPALTTADIDRIMEIIEDELLKTP